VSSPTISILSRGRAAVILVIGAALMLLPSLAVACPVCMSGREEDTRFAFIWTTAFLTAMPLVLVGGVIFWLRRRLKTDDAPRAVPVHLHAGSEPTPLRALRES
jgi:hypothetical protein